MSKFKQITWKQIVKIADPKKSKEQHYKFSNGKVFYGKKKV